MKFEFEFIFSCTLEPAFLRMLLQCFRTLPKTTYKVF